MARTFSTSRKEEKPKLISSPLHLIIAILLFLLLLFLIQTFLLKTYTIPSSSMKPTINPGERILVDRFAYRVGDPKVGDVIVFRAPKSEGKEMPCLGGYQKDQACFRANSESGNTDYIKRVVALPGDRLSLRRGSLFVNGQNVFSQFEKSCLGKDGACHLPLEITVPKGHYFVLGDNRGDSFDSRYWGPVARQWIVGRARFTYWPPNRFGSL